ncbi:MULTISPECIES: DUF4230 domain-containing protein [unclassified Streptomyces]|uniref:DUF4230 domain-containing protein n=1 Tax=unclassified Streptomyces TaxID=2593676 RepID=UPI00278BD7DF|nr:MULTISPECIES: DUF4230 domain-containing protein [unclassified Streptomyces]
MTPRTSLPRWAALLPRWTKAVIALAVVLAVLFTGLSLMHRLDDVFGTETHDRSGPALLKSVRDLSRYEAAAGNYQVVVDLDKDSKYLPDAIQGTRTLYVGAGTVNAYVDLGKVGQDDVRVNRDRTSATLRLPHARLAAPTLDTDRSYAVAKQRGLLDRLGDLFSDNPGDERAVRQLAARHIGEAARDSGLTGRAERNTTDMMRGLLRSLGFREVDVSYGT